MPQASEEDRARAVQRWGSIESSGPEDYLRKAGWTLTQQWEWIPPGEWYDISDDEWFAIMFLVWEWDYGGLASEGTIVRHFMEKKE